MKSPNAYRVQYEEDKFRLELGYFNPPDSTEKKGIVENESDVLTPTGLDIPPYLLKDILAELIIAGIKYQEEYGKDLGFGAEELNDPE